MGNATKQALATALTELLNTTTLDNITVKDIVDRADVSRQTFYYHFEDMPALIEEIISEEVDNIIDEHPEIDSLEQCIEVAVEFTIRNKRAVLHIYNSANRSTCEKYLMEVCEKVVQSYAKKVFKNKNIDEFDKKILMQYFKCECFGQVMVWMGQGMKEDISASLNRLLELRRGMTEELVNRCVK